MLILVVLKMNVDVPLNAVVGEAMGVIRDLAVAEVVVAHVNAKVKHADAAANNAVAIMLANSLN